MTYLTQDVDIHNEQVIEDMVADFDIFLREQYWDGCNAIIDNLRDLGEYSKGIELAKRLTARKMTVPSDYGEDECCGKCNQRGDCSHTIQSHPELACECHKKTLPADYGEETRVPALDWIGEKDQGIW